jgi:hypothetical protein
MDESRSRVKAIQGEVTASFKCQAATVFDQKMTDWLTRQQQIRNAFEQIFDSFGTAQGGISAAHDDAANVGGNAYGAVYGGLG